MSDKLVFGKCKICHYPYKTQLLSESSIPVATINAYLSAHYTVLTDEPFTLSIGHRSQELASYFMQYKTNSAAFITACNPLGQRCSDTQNQTAQLKLTNLIAAQSLNYLHGVGRDPIGQWPEENSLLIFGISPEKAKQLAEKLNQNGFVFADDDATPQLILLR